MESVAGADTFVNAQEHPISKHPLRSRDLIRCGGLWIQFIMMRTQPRPRSGRGQLPGTVQTLLATAASGALREGADARCRKKGRPAH